MRGEIISREFQNISWVKDSEGKEYACYSADISNKDQLSDDDKQRCTDLSSVLGDSW